MKPPASTTHLLQCLPYDLPKDRRKARLGCYQSVMTRKGISVFTTARAATCALLMMAAGGASAHDLFVSFANDTSGRTYLRTAVVSNGTFHESAGAVTRERLRDVSVHQAGARHQPDLAGWKVIGKQSQLGIRPPTRGTYLLGVSTTTSTSTRTAVEFAEYLKLEDLPDTLATYDASRYPQGVTYNYTKHARAIGQAGTVLTKDYAASLGYPLEIRLERHPASVKAGERVGFHVLHKGVPVPDLRVHAGSAAPASLKSGPVAPTEVRTDAKGRAEFLITAAGIWYIHTNRMVPSDQKEVDFVSDRASLTFEIASRGRRPQVRNR